MGKVCDRVQWPEVPAQDHSPTHTGGSAPGGGKRTNTHFEALGFKVVMIDEPPAPPPTTKGPDEEAIETALSLEYDLENSLVANLEQLESDLKLYRENGVVG